MPTPTGANLSDSRLVVVTDLGISAKCADSHVFVWVCSLKEAKPSGGVEVTAYSANNQLIAKAVTNADGVAAIPCNAADKNTSPFLVTAQLADDLSYLPLDRQELRGDRTAMHPRGTTLPRAARRSCSPTVGSSVPAKPCMPAP